MTRINAPALVQTYCSARTRLARLSAAFLAAALMTGCAGTVDKTAASLDLTKESIVVMSMRMTNAYRPDFPVKSLGFGVESLDEVASSTSSTAREHGVGGTGKPQLYRLEDVEPGRGEALVLMRLPPGRYSMTTLQGQTPIGLLIGAASIHFGVQAPFEVPAQSVLYLGHLDMVNKEKTASDDQASGLAIPLIPQAAAGFSGGTLDVKLKNRYALDIAWLRAAYPAMQTVQVNDASLKSIALARRSGSTAAPIQVSIQKP